jgi:hypothetical protein
MSTHWRTTTLRALMTATAGNATDLRDAAAWRLVF